jgi:hypothetical protein
MCSCCNRRRGSGGDRSGDGNGEEEDRPGLDARTRAPPVLQTPANLGEGCWPATSDPSGPSGLRALPPPPAAAPPPPWTPKLGTFLFLLLCNGARVCGGELRFEGSTCGIGRGGKRGFRGGDRRGAGAGRRWPKSVGVGGGGKGMGRRRWEAEISVSRTTGPDPKSFAKILSRTVRAGNLGRKARTLHACIYVHTIRAQV